MSSLNEKYVGSIFTGYLPANTLVLASQNTKYQLLRNCMLKQTSLYPCQYPEHQTLNSRYCILHQLNDEPHRSDSAIHTYLNLSKYLFRKVSLISLQDSRPGNAVHNSEASGTHSPKISKSSQHGRETLCCFYHA